MAKGKLFKKGVAYIIDRAVRKIDAAKEEWARATIDGFRTDWNVWMSQHFEPNVRAVVMRLPEKSADIRVNVVNRVVPVATIISEQAKRYRAAKVATITTPPRPAPTLAM
jgi:hypothetical protein